MTKAKATIMVTQTGSPIRREKWQHECLRSLGLGKMHKTRELVDNQIVRGLIRKVHHLVRVDESK